VSGSLPTPSRYRLPQDCSADRKRARSATLELQRQKYLLATDSGPGNPSEGFRLPTGAAMLPAEDDFDAEKKARLLGHKMILHLRSPVVRARVGRRPEDYRDYERVVGWLRHPTLEKTWQADAEFARQRLTGTNPMSLRRCNDLPADALARAADRVLGERHRIGLNAALDAGRLFRTDYVDLLDPRIQSHVARGAWLAAPSCLFFVDGRGELFPLAIQLAPAGFTGHAVVTPLDPPAHWLLARCHAQSADAHYHEAVYHLLETHMVSEVFALCTARHLHPDHPLHQLLYPHFQGTLAINYLARHDLLSPGGPIDVVLASGVGGALDLARLVWSRWSFRKRTLEGDLADRGVGDAKALPGYFYRDDARAIWQLLNGYIERVLQAWYLDDEGVRGDYELRAWCEDVARLVPDFPRVIDSRQTLATLMTDVVFRASAQHSAVNNGQFQTYGFVPNAPGTVFARLPDGNEAQLEERDVVRALPDRDHSIAQLGMAWVLSQPTHRSLLTTGETPAFSRDFCPAAHDAVLVLRRGLVELAETIGARNDALGDCYTYLCPYDVARSTAV